MMATHGSEFTPIVFLHIPKTAGQTIHHALARLVGGERHVSPVRLHGSAATPESQFPPGYRLYSGHIDFARLDTVKPDPFVFTILRDPLERIASFYFFLLKEAQALDEAELEQPDNLGKREILRLSADDYFTGGDPAWQNFVRNYYDNFYCTYFATGLMRGYGKVRQMDDAELLDRAEAGLGRMDRVYHTGDLTALELDMAERYGGEIKVAGKYQNASEMAPTASRWERLAAELDRDETRDVLKGFAARDIRLMERMGLG
jgi:hypothetical protein